MAPASTHPACRACHHAACPVPHCSMPLHQAAGQQDPWASLLGSAVEGEGITVVCGGGGGWVAFVRVRMCGVLDAWVGVGGAMLVVRLCSGGPPQVQHVGRHARAAGRPRSAFGWHGLALATWPLVNITSLAPTPLAGQQLAERREPVDNAARSSSGSSSRSAWAGLGPGAGV